MIVSRRTFLIGSGAALAVAAMPLGLVSRGARSPRFSYRQIVDMLFQNVVPVPGDLLLRDGTSFLLLSDGTTRLKLGR